MKKEELLGIIGSLMMILSVFIPSIGQESFTYYKHEYYIYSFIKFNQTAGFIIIILAIISFAYSIAKKTDYNIIWGLFSLIVLFTVLFIRPDEYSGYENIKLGFIGEFKIGIAVLILGSIMVTVSHYTGKKVKIKEKDKQMEINI